MTMTQRWPDSLHQGAPENKATLFWIQYTRPFRQLFWMSVQLPLLMAFYTSELRSFQKQHRWCPYLSNLTENHGNILEQKSELKVHIFIYCVMSTNMRFCMDMNYTLSVILDTEVDMQYFYTHDSYFTPCDLQITSRWQFNAFRPTGAFSSQNHHRNIPLKCRFIIIKHNSCFSYH